jgi:hypothetical protein
MSKENQIARQEFDRVLDYIKLKDWKGNEHTLISQMVEFSFEEEIFHQSLHGSIKIFDSVDFPTLLPMIGEERILASFTRQEPANKQNAFLGGRLPPIKFDMRVYRMDNKYQSAESRKAQSYTLRYTSHLPFLNINKRVFASYQNMKYSDMVKDIYENYLKEEGAHYKPLVIEETEGAFDYYAQNLSPLSAIRKISQRSTSAEGNGNFYVFYEDRDSYYFITVGKLLRQDPSIKLRCELKNVSKIDAGGSKTTDLERQLYNVTNYTRNENFDVFQSALSGEASSSLLSVDPVTRQYYLNEFDLRGKDRAGNDNWSKLPKLGDKKPWTDANPMFIDPKANMAMLITDLDQDTHEYIAERDSVRPYMPEDFFLDRISQKRQLLKNTIQASVSGDPRVKVGQVVEFNPPEILGITGTKNPEMPDKWLKGKYLVVGVLHAINQAQYSMHLQLVKDGFATEISDVTYRHPSKVYKGYHNS